MISDAANWQSGLCAPASIIVYTHKSGSLYFISQVLSGGIGRRGGDEEKAATHPEMGSILFQLSPGRSLRLHCHLLPEAQPKPARKSAFKPGSIAKVINSQHSSSITYWNRNVVTPRSPLSSLLHFTISPSQDTCSESACPRDAFRSITQG